MTTTEGALCNPRRRHTPPLHCARRRTSLIASAAQIDNKRLRGCVQEGVISTVKAHGVKAHFLDQRGFLNGTFGPACCGHPSIEVDTAMAKSGAAFIKQTLGW